MAAKRLANFKEKGAALIELALTFPIALTIVLASVHLSDVLRESAVIVEASRHGARAVTAQSGMPGPSQLWFDTPLVATYCNNMSSAPADSAQRVALIATCGFMESYLDSKWNAADWIVSSQISNTTEESVTFWTISVNLRPSNPRGPVNFFIDFINLKPQNTAVFPLMRVGVGG